MANRCITSAITIALFLWCPLSVGASQQLEWQDLTTPIDARDDPYYGLGLEQRNSLDTLLELQKRRRAGEPANQDDAVAEQAALEQLAASKLDGHELVAKEASFLEKLKRQRTGVRDEWDGVDIRLPGYLVPLEFDTTQVVEFVLVPYAGACIHTPPPPANQMVLVRYQDGFPLRELFTPVWVTGRLSVDRSEQSVPLSDGTAAFEVSYSLNATQVVEYH